MLIVLAAAVSCAIETQTGALLLDPDTSEEQVTRFQACDVRRNACSHKLLQLSYSACLLKRLMECTSSILTVDTLHYRMLWQLAVLLSVRLESSQTLGACWQHQKQFLSPQFMAA